MLSEGTISSSVASSVIAAAEGGNGSGSGGSKSSDPPSAELWGGAEHKHECQSAPHLHLLCQLTEHVDDSDAVAVASGALGAGAGTGAGVGVGVGVAVAVGAAEDRTVEEEGQRIVLDFGEHLLNYCLEEVSVGY